VNRFLVLSVNETPDQTAAIHRQQRAAYMLNATARDVQAVRTRHQHAQRLLEPLSVVIPWAEQLSFRTDQTRTRRDHATYLSLIASLALLHQHQRKRATRLRNGVAEPCVVATAADLEWANRLATDALGARRESLLPQTRQLLEQLDAYVTKRCDEERVDRIDVRFTQRELREALHWPDRALRRQLSRLVDLEYVLVYRTGCGNQRVYQLLHDGCAAESALSLLGLTEAQRLTKTKTPRKAASALP
jgi:hypothetical protein